MASNKNQHFVPKCYLKPFSLDGKGSAINLFNIERNRFIRMAPLKNQCSRDYFYGEDLILETWFQAIEGSYAELIKAIGEPGYILTPEHRTLLREFWLIQHLRTEAASRRLVEMHAQFGRTADMPPDFIKIEIKEAVQSAVGVAMERFMAVADMKVCLLRNRTSEPFITSDDPAVLTNLWHLVASSNRKRSFGVAAAGAIFLLPITPWIMCVAYDGDVYNLRHSGGWSDVGRVFDVHAFNQHQLLNCWANVYVPDPEHEESVRRQFANIAQLRPESHHIAHYAVRVGTSDGASKFQVINNADQRPEHDEALIHVEIVRPCPTAWPMQIARRMNGSVFSDGSARGFIRRAETLKTGVRRFTKLRPWR